jgi:hypothetical protein
MDGGHLDRIEPRREVAPERASTDLNAYLTAHLALERASLRRSRVVHLSALVGLPCALGLALLVSRRAHGIALAGVVGALTLSALALLGELRCLRVLRRTERGVRVTRG